MANVPLSRAWMGSRSTDQYSYQRAPAFMVEEPQTFNVSTVGMPTAADVARCNGVPPIAIPYMALQNLNRPDGTGKRVIVPMVTGFESTFLANSLQGLLCLPGCESVLMGELVSTTAATAASLAATQKDDDVAMAANEEETAGISMDGGDTQSARSSSSSSPSPSMNGSDADSIGPSGDLDGTAAEEGERGGGGSGSGNNDGTARESGKTTRVLRGGIRCHGSVRVKTAVSRAYADFVLQHLEEGEIQLKTPAPRSTSTEAVTDQQLDEAGELETLRGQTPNVPRCLAPVLLPEERPGRCGWRAGGGHSGGHALAGLCASSPLSPLHPTALASTAAAGVGLTLGCNGTAPSNHVSVVPPVNDAEKTLLTASEHSCSDNSPTPSSGDEDGAEAHSSEERERAADVAGSGGEGSGQPHHALAGETRVGLRHGAQDGRRFTCFASNSVENMPEYHFPRLASDDLVELTEFMVVRSSVQPDEAVDLNLASHILGDPRNVAHLPPEVRTALVNRAARLMEAAVFLQI